MYMRWKPLVVLGIGMLALILGGCVGRWQAQAPQALFALRPAEGVAPLTVTCDATLSYDEDGQIVEYLWDFGDGARGMGPIVSHTYQTGGSYRIRLQVFDDQGLSDQIETQIQVEYPPPVAQFSYAPWRPGTGEFIHFDASASYSPNGEIVEYQWSFGDGNWTTGQVVEHRYWYGGGYPVTLTVTDEVGAKATVTQVIEVQVGPGCYTP
ncbi:MAG TPA: PKD domain-containing protein [Candidatus Acetothermia bacterium]|nr:PKD domain-containing protein [Candidatus Acetothermia bacterium]